jgi:hypothetical protein
MEAATAENQDLSPPFAGVTAEPERSDDGTWIRRLILESVAWLEPT